MRIRKYICTLNALHGLNGSCLQLMKDKTCLLMSTEEEPEKHDWGVMRNSAQWMSLGNEERKMQVLDGSTETD